MFKVTNKAGTEIPIKVQRSQTTPAYHYTFGDEDKTACYLQLVMPVPYIGEFPNPHIEVCKTCARVLQIMLSYERMDS